MNITEDFGEIVLAKSNEEFKWLHSRKRLLVNGMHFVFAVYGYARLISLNTQDLPVLASTPIMPILIKDMDIQDSVRKISYLFIALIVCQRSDLNSRDQRDEIEQFVISLLKYSSDVIDRFQRNPDSLDRVLQMDLQSSYAKFGRFYINELTKLPRMDPKRFEEIFNSWFMEDWCDSISGSLKEFKIKFEEVSGVFLDSSDQP